MSKMDNMMEQGVAVLTRPTVRAAPIVFILKKDRTLWLCVDYRPPNTMTIWDTYQSPE